MYPFRDENVYVKNCWYVAALRSEVNRQPFERTICDEPIVFYRTEAGTAVALYGLCPHRYYPLARGKLVGDAIECGYHGFTFDCHGKCTKVPSLGDKGLNFSQRAFPVVEHGPWVWIWPGDASRADPLALPNLAVLGCDVSGSHLKDWHVHAEDPKPFAAGAQLIIDNLIDLTHIAFLHSSLIDCSHLLRAPIQIKQLGETGLRIRRSVENGSCDYARDKALGNLFFRDILKFPHRRGRLHSHEQRVHQFGGGPRYRGC